MSTKKKSKNTVTEPNISNPPVRPAEEQRHYPQDRQYTQPRQPRPPKQYQQPRKFKLPAVVRTKIFQYIVIAVIAFLPSLYFYNASRQAKEQAANPSSSKLQTTAEVVKQVSRHILLPSGEQPTIATISDASKVRGQTFFANAANGDKVLVYAQAKKAYLYRPGIDRIIEVAPLAPNKTTP